MLLYNDENPIKIVVADDHEVVRVGITKLLSFSKLIQIVDEVTNGLELINSCKKFNPDIAFVDILMPKMSGIEAIPIAKKASPNTAFIMLTAFEDFQHIEKALLAGADGYLTKGVSAKILQEAVFNVMKGDRVFSKSILKLIRDRKMTYDETNDLNVSITKREQEILQLIAVGNTNQEISEKLNLSIRTVETHRHNLIKKFELKNAAQLVRFAIINSENIE
jgi:DNA-binding NarL/FixJ family response regulator